MTQVIYKKRRSRIGLGRTLPAEAIQSASATAQSTQRAQPTSTRDGIYQTQPTSTRGGIYQTQPALRKALAQMQADMDALHPSPKRAKRRA